MIRVIITGPPLRDGKLPYRIEGATVANNRIPITQMAAKEPLLEACTVLARMGEPLDRLVGLYQEGDLGKEPGWSARTSVGYGSRYTAPPEEKRTSGLASPDAGPSSDEPARPEAEQSQPSTPLEPIADTSPAAPKPPKTAKTHHRPKAKGSSGRRGLSSGR